MFVPQPGVFNLNVTNSMLVKHCVLYISLRNWRVGGLVCTLQFDVEGKANRNVYSCTIRYVVTTQKTSVSTGTAVRTPNLALYVSDVGG